MANVSYEIDDLQHDRAYIQTLLDERHEIDDKVKVLEARKKEVNEELAALITANGAKVVLYNGRMNTVVNGSSVSYKTENIKADLAAHVPSETIAQIWEKNKTVTSYTTISVKEVKE